MNQKTAQHFLLECGRNLVSKIKMMDTISDLLNEKNLENLFGVHLLLHGSNQLSYMENCRIFEAVQVFIMESKRFQ